MINMSTLTNLESAKQTNQFTMNMISNMKPCNNVPDLVENNSANLDTQIKSNVLDRAMEAVYMQNKIIGTIEMLENKECFTTDNKGVITILESLLVGSNTSEVKEG